MPASTTTASSTIGTMNSGLEVTGATRGAAEGSTGRLKQVLSSSSLLLIARRTYAVMRLYPPGVGRKGLLLVTLLCSMLLLLLLLNV